MSERLIPCEVKGPGKKVSSRKWVRLGAVDYAIEQLEGPYRLELYNAEGDRLGTCFSDHVIKSLLESGPTYQIVPAQPETWAIHLTVWGDEKGVDRCSISKLPVVAWRIYPEFQHSAEPVYGLEFDASAEGGALFICETKRDGNPFWFDPRDSNLNTPERDAALMHLLGKVRGSTRIWEPLPELEPLGKDDHGTLEWLDIYQELRRAGALAQFAARPELKPKKPEPVE